MHTAGVVNSLELEFQHLLIGHASNECKSQCNVGVMYRYSGSNKNLSSPPRGATV